MREPIRASLIFTACALAAYGCNRSSRQVRGEDSAGRGASALPKATPANDTLAFHAIGTEPFWSLDVGPTGLRFRTPEDTLGALFPPVAALASGDTLRWTTSSGSASVEARLWPGTCSDGMSDRVWPYHAAVRLDTTAYRGCAEPRVPERR